MSYRPLAHLLPAIVREAQSRGQLTLGIGSTRRARPLRMGTHGNKGRERLTKRERQALKDEGGVIDRGNTAAAGTRLAFRKSSCGVNTGPRRRKLDTRRPAKTFELLLNCSRRPLRRPRSDRHLMGARLLMRVAAVALLRVAAAAPLPTTWPPPHNTSTQCAHMLAKHKLD